MKKLLLISVILTSFTASSNEYLLTLDKKHYENRVSIKPKEVVDVKDSFEGKHETPITSGTGGINFAKLQDNIWDCSVSGTYSGDEEIRLTLGSPKTFNTLISAGMARQWRYPLSFYAVVDGSEVHLGDILTGGYCEEDKKTTLKFGEITTSEIIVRTPENMYIGEIELINE